MSKSPRQSIPPAEICGYRIVKILSPDRCFQAISSAGGRRVVLKMLEQDCLLRGQLHPSIKERLARVRELAHLSVANLFGVEKEGDDAYLVWEFLDGQTWEEYCDAKSPRDVLVAARELVLAVEAMHAQGIVHGELHGRNVLVDADRRIRLTHVSPLLFNEPSEDAIAVIALLEYTLGRRGEENSALGDLLRAARAKGMPLRELRPKLTALIESRELEVPREVVSSEDRATRKRALMSAGAVAIFGALIAGGVWGYSWWTGGRFLSPPQASAEALQSRTVTASSNAQPSTVPTTQASAK